MDALIVPSLPSLVDIVQIVVEKTVVNVIPLVCFSLCLKEGVIYFDKHPNFKMLFARYGRDWSGDSWEDNIYKLYNKDDDNAVMPINIPCTAKRKTTN